MAADLRIVVVICKQGWRLYHEFITIYLALRSEKTDRERFQNVRLAIIHWEAPDFRSICLQGDQMFLGSDGSLIQYSSPRKAAVGSAREQNGRCICV